MRLKDYPKLITKVGNKFFEFSTIIIEINEIIIKNEDLSNSLSTLLRKNNEIKKFANTIKPPYIMKSFHERLLGIVELHGSDIENFVENVVHSNDKLNCLSELDDKLSEIINRMNVLINDVAKLIRVIK
ncbi:hypothetical protein WGM54_14455 [Paenibacillus polymyxa]|uniref:hypothetical protein n=1 Tax=Paenibacillus polymyxa TaxID=1406 RepID=UPI00307E50EB